MASLRSLGSLTLDLIVKIGGFVAGMTKAEREADSRLRRIEKRAAGFAKNIGNALGLSLAGIATGAVLAIDRAIDRMDELRDASLRLGIGVETLSAFSFAAEQTGTSVEELGKGLKILAKNAADALKPGSQKETVFDAIGVSVKDAQGNLRDLEDLIPDIAGAFQQLEDGTTKAALAQELFGKSGLSLIEFLNQGEDGLREFTERARELGLVIDQEAADKADQFKDDLAALQGAVLGVATAVAVELLPPLIELVNKAKDWVTEAGGAKIIADELSGAFRAVAESASFVWNAFDTAAMAAKGLAYNLAGAYKVIEAGQRLSVFDVAGAQQAIADLKEFEQVSLDAAKHSGEGWREFNSEFSDVAQQVRKETDATAKAAAESLKFDVPGITIPVKFDVTAPAFSAVGTGNKQIDKARLERALAGIVDKPDKPKRGGGGGGGKSDAERAAEDAKREAESARESIDQLNASYREQITLFGETSEAVRLRYQFEQESLADLDPATRAYIEQQREQALIQAEKVDQLRDEEEVQRRLDQVEERRQEAVKGVLEDIRIQGDLLGKTAQYQDTYNKLLYAGVDANSAFGQSIIAANDALWQQKEAIDAQVEFMDLARDHAKNFLSDLRDGLREGKDGWDILLDAVNQFADALFDMIASNLVKRALGESGSTSGGAGGGIWENIAKWVGGLFASGGGGGASGGSFVGPRAIGGVTVPGALYPVNEHGPELWSSGGKDYLMIGDQFGTVKPIREGSMGSQGKGNVYVTNYNLKALDDQSTRDQIAAHDDYTQRRERSRSGRR